MEVRLSKVGRARSIVGPCPVSFGRPIDAELVSVLLAGNLLVEQGLNRHTDRSSFS